MKFKFDFIPQGSKISKENNFFIYKDQFTEKKWSTENTVILDTGNKLEPGIIDHHQPDAGAEEACVAVLIIQEAKQYLGHLKNQQEVTIVTHFLPDLDAIGSVYFTQKYLSGKAFTAADKLLSEYILEVDAGKLFIDPEYPVSIASIWLAVTNMQGKAPFEADNQEITEKGIDYLNHIVKLVEATNNPWDIYLLDNLTGFEKEKQYIINDKATYDKDLTLRSEVNVIRCHNYESGGYDQLDCILTDQPKSILWKYWVRGDRNNSIFGEGFSLTCAFWNRRAIISVDPNTPYNLKGLGLLIDRMEVDVLLENNSLELIRNGEPDENGKIQGPRPSFHRNDPWYDGRGFHHFTIIDAPRSGTELSNEVIKKCIFATDCWESYSRLHDKDEDILLEELLQQPTPVIYNSELLNQVENLEKDFDKVNLNHIGEYKEKLQSLLFTSKQNTFDNKRIYDKLSEFTRIFTEWLSKLDGQTLSSYRQEIVSVAAEALPQNEILNILKRTKNLDNKLFFLLLDNSYKGIKKDAIYNLLLDLQDRHPHIFQKHNILEFDIIFSKFLTAKSVTDIIKKLEVIVLHPNAIKWEEELPIYGFNKLKNYIDDLFVCESLAGQSIKKEIIDFASNDFEAFFKEIDTPNIDLFEAKKNHTLLRSNFLKSLFGETFEVVTVEKNKLLQHFKGRVAKLIKRYSVQELIELPFFEIKNLIVNLKEDGLTDKNKNLLLHSEYFKFLTLLSEFAALDNLFLRLEKYYNLQNNIDYGTYFNELHKLIYHTFNSISLYPNSTEIDAVEKHLDLTLESIEKLRIIPAESDVFSFKELLSGLGDFISSVKGEMNISVSAVQEQLDHSLNQLLRITGKGGLIDQINRLPFYYRVLLIDIFESYKVYYRERHSFFKNELNAIINQSVSENDEKSKSNFVDFYNRLINESVKFDLQEIKNHVDDSADEKLIDNYYEKYFQWQKLNIEGSTDELYKLNSDIRFAEGKSRDLGSLINAIPIKKQIKNYNEFVKDLAYKWNLNNAITHIPINLIHQSYDYILNSYIDKFDIDNVRDSLHSFSTKFPWYYRWFTNRNAIQSTFLIVCLLLIAVGIFDTTIYDIGNETFMTPAAQFIFDLIGEPIFNTISYGLHIFWGSILSLVFTLPLAYGLWLLVRRFIPSNKAKTSRFKFLDLVSGIEEKRIKLLYPSFILPLLFVVIQMASPNTISMINNIGGVRLISTFIMIVGLTLFSVYLTVNERNPNRTRKWVIAKTKHMFWLHLLQALLLTVFTIDLLLRFEVNMSMFESKQDILVTGISKYIEINFGFFDFKIMPVFSIIVAFLTLFFSFFIEKVMKK